MISPPLLRKKLFRSFHLCTLTFGVLASVALPASAVPVREVKSPGGITAWFVEDHTLPIVAMQFSFEGGVAADPAGKEGLSYLLSGMLDEGAGSFSSQAFQARVDDLALKLSFETGLDHFVGSFQTLSQNRKEAFSLLHLVLNKPRFDPEPLEKVRHQVQNLIKRDLEDPETLAHQAWMSLAFGTHPYSKPEKGTLETLKGLSSQDLRSLHSRLFAKKSLKISVVGDITEEELKQVLDQTFGDLPEHTEIPKIAEARLPEHAKETVLKYEIPQSIVLFGFSGIKRDDPEFIPTYVMNFVLGEGGFGSRLMEEIREKRGLTYGISTSFYPLQYGGFFLGSFSTMNEKAHQTLSLVREEIAKLAKDGPTETELNEAKTYLLGSYALRFDSNRKISSQLNGFQRQGLDISYVNERNALIERVSLDDVKKAAKKFLHPDALLVSIVGKPK